MELPTHDSPYDEALAVAVRAAHRGAAVIRDQAGSLKEVREKNVNDFVTATDEAAQTAILVVLQEEDPGTPVLAEEGADLENHSVVVEEQRWIVDPLDGTSNFMHQVPPYAVSIGLQVKDAVVAGVVLDVTHDDLFTAVLDHGLRQNGHPVAVSDTQAFRNAFLATGFPYRRFEHIDAYLDVLGTILRAGRSVRRHGSAAVDLARVACGRFDGFFETGLDPWDAAAGMLLVREGGGRVTDYRDQSGLTPLFDGQVCASNGCIHEPLLEHLSSMQNVRL